MNFVVNIYAYKYSCQRAEIKGDLTFIKRKITKKISEATCVQTLRTMSHLIWESVMSKNFLSLTPAILCSDYTLNNKVGEVVAEARRTGKFILRNAVT
jgi:hypothetical protein